MEYDGFDERPFLVFWEITRACALACKHCRAEAQSHRHPDELNREESSQLIQELAELKPPMLILTGGDPLMRRDALDLVREATEAGLHVSLSPSATGKLMNIDFAEIKAAGVERISLSLDGATRETHDAFRGVTGTFVRTISAVHRAHAAGIGVQINTTLTRGNLHEYEAFKQLMFELKPEMWSVFLLVPTGRAQASDLPDPQDIEHVFQEHSLPRGVFVHRGKAISPDAIRDTALLAIEGEKDDISGIGQTKAALDLASHLPDAQKKYHLATDVGHYGIFNGSKWRTKIAPVVEEWMRANPR